MPALALYCAQSGRGQSASARAAECPTVTVSCADTATRDTPLFFNAEVGALPESCARTASCRGVADRRAARR